MILITGATGTVGRPVVDALIGRGVAVRAISRSTTAPPAGVERVGAALPAGVEYVSADLARPESIAAALDGVSALFVHPRAVGESAGKLMAMAAEHGVRRVVVLSAINVDDDPAYQPSRQNGDRNKEVEDAVTGSGLPWVAIRSGTFAVNAIDMFGAQVRAGDVVRAPYANFAESPIHEADLAAVIAHALLHDDLDGRRIPVTGPESLTHEEQVAVFGKVLGRSLTFVEVKPGAAAAGMVAHGIPDAFVTALMARYARGAGHPADITDEVERILGRPAHTFASWVADHSHEFLSA